MTEDLGALPTEARHADTGEFDRMTALEMVWAMHRADAEALVAVERALPQVARVVEAASERVGRGGRLLYFGAGTSGRLGVLDASECPPTFCTPPEMVQGVIAGGEHALRHAVEGAEDSAELGAEAVRALSVGALDVVVGIAASGRTPYVLGVLGEARRLGALAVGVSCVPGSAVERAVLGGGGVHGDGAGGADGVLVGAGAQGELDAAGAALAVTMATGAEVVTGSTRLKAGTATKLVLNMISTGVMARLGYVYGNLMVNVQPTNAKLRDRAVRIVVELTGLGVEDAARALEAARGEVKTAAVMVLRGENAAAARARVGRAGGVLRVALEG